MTRTRLRPILALLLLLLGLSLGPGAAGAADPLERRLDSWPAWSLPAPLPRPGRGDLVWPVWFSGSWRVTDCSAAGEAAPAPAAAAAAWTARFLPAAGGGAVADRAFNAAAIGRATLGDQLVAVRDDPANPNRQLTRLQGDLLLESSVVGRRSTLLDPDTFLTDELTLQVLHGPGEPRVSRVEVLGRWRRLADGRIAGEQWQASYGSPADGLATTALRTGQSCLSLAPAPPGSDPAS